MARADNPRRCSFSGCAQPHEALGYCHLHVRRWRTRGDPTVGRCWRGTAAERFWSKVDKSGGPDACWLWTAGRDKAGYGRFNLDGHTIMAASRAGWILTFGPVPEGLSVLHHCDNPPCVNLTHLFLGTDAINAADKVAKGRARGPSRRTACDAGHVRTDANTYVVPSTGKPSCRICTNHWPRTKTPTPVGAGG